MNTTQTAKQLVIYSEQCMPPLPREVGNWERIERVCDGSKPTWRLTFENAVGGSIGYRFRTKRALELYKACLSKIRCTASSEAA